MSNYIQITCCTDKDINFSSLEEKFLAIVQGLTELGSESGILLNKSGMITKRERGNEKN